MASPLIIKGVLDRFEDKLAVIKSQDNTEIFWPIKNLPEEISAGSSIRLTLSTNKDDEQDRKDLAKSMINDILNAPSKETKPK